MTPALLALVLLQSSPAAATSPFNGVWLMDAASTIPDAEPESFSLARGRFSRGTGDDALSVPADGRFHRIPADRYVDAVSVTKVGDRLIREIDRLDGRTVYAINYALSADGGTLTRRVVDYSKPDGGAVHTTLSYRRLGRAPSRGSPLTGRWKLVAIGASNDRLTETISLVGDRFVSHWVGGGGFEARVGGPPVPVVGDAADARTAVTMPDDRTVVLHGSLGGKPTMRVTMTMQPDHRTIHVTGQRLADGVNRHWVLTRR